MNKIRRVFWVVAALALVGCASSAKRIANDVRPSPSFGYVGGDFTLKKHAFSPAFVLVNIETKAEYFLAFTNKHTFDRGNRETGLIQLPPGQYQITEYVVFNTFWGPGKLQGQEYKSSMSDKKLSTPFTVKENSVVFLGKFTAAYEWTPGYYISGDWKTEPITALEAKNLLLNEYPLFGQADFSCTTCQQ